MKNWREYQFKVNGLLEKIQYNQATVDNLFIPFLKRLTEIQKLDNRRVICFIVAAPATGKSTLTLFFEKLSREIDELIPVQAVGMDGFHYRSDFIKTHSINRGGKSIPMSAVKGSPETFDIDKIRDKLVELQNSDAKFPIYDRKIHDVIDDALEVNGKIILFEGNWLLLKDQNWKDLKRFSDYTLMIKSDPAMLRDRLIQRKVQGGLSIEDATEFYESSDSHNVERVLRDSDSADEIWQMLDDNDYELA